MKPKHIFLVRHGQSEGNVNKDIYGTKPDYALELTKNGEKEALEVGKDIANFLQEYNLVRTGEATTGRVQFYISPFWRTRQTAELIQQNVTNFSKYEDPRLREQEWGHLKARYSPELEEERDSYGHFYYRFPDGESCADVYDRVSDFLNTLHRDFEKQNYPRTTIIVTHGMTMRLFLMRWFHLSVEEFELLANPQNCECYILKKGDEGKYTIRGQPRKHLTRKHPYQYQWGKYSHEARKTDS